jgi:signal transduction histidine kinase
VLHAGALEVNAPDERTAEGAALIRTTGREALAELREVLGILRAPAVPLPDSLPLSDSVPVSGSQRLSPLPMLADLDRLLEQSRSLGMPVNRLNEGEVRQLPVSVQRAAYRVVQEALTNVHKHADDAATDVVLRYLPGMLEIAVRNGPPPRPAGRPHARPNGVPPVSGFGLIGLRERVELLGGRFQARRQLHGGFAILARIPTANEPAKAPA